MKKLFALLLALVMCIGLFAGCNNTPEATDAPTDAPTEAPTAAPETDPPTMPPTVATDEATEDANQNGWLKLGSVNERFPYNNLDYGGFTKNFLWSRLLMIDGQGVVIGTDLAESYTVSDDGLTWTIKIKDNANWHDGTPVTAEDFKWTVEAIAKGAQANAVFTNALSAIDGFTECREGTATEIVGIVADGKTITLNCDKVASTMGLTLGQMNVNPKHLLGEVNPVVLHDAEYWQKPIGSGFYKVGEYVEGKYWKLVPNEDFYDADRIPQIQQIYIGYTAGGTTTSDLVLSCQTGDVHIGTTMSPDEATEVAKLDNYAVIPSDIYYIRMIEMNMHGQGGSGDSLFEDIRVRQAVMYGVDRQSICDDMFSGFASVLNTKVPTSFSYYAEDATVYEYNPEKAKQLIADAGIDLSSTVKLGCYYSDQQSKDVCEAIVYYLGEIGFNAELVFITGDLIQGIYETRDYDLLYSGLSAMAPEETYGVFCHLTEDMLDAKLLPVGDNGFEPIYDELLVTTDAERRTELLKDLQREEANYLYHLPLFSVNMNLVIRTDMLNVGTYAGGNEWFNHDRDVETWNLLKVEDPTK